MTLTVRLDPTLESALQRYSVERGVTKSLLVQEALAEYLTVRAARRPPPAVVSENYKAFERAGLIGSFEGGAGADKEGVRRRIGERFAEKARKR